MRFGLIIVLVSVACNSPQAPSMSGGPDANASQMTAVSSPVPSAPPPVWDVRFSPNGGCTDLEGSFIRSATKSVHLQAYGFTSAPIADALCEMAQKPGMDVTIILDKSNLTDKHSMMGKVKNCGAVVWIDSKHQIAHNKLTLVDGKASETGSFNYTASAEHGNAENCLILRIPELAQEYEKNFQLHKAHSESHL